MPDPRIVIAVPTQELGLSLLQWLLDLPGEKGLSVSLPDSFALELFEFPSTTADLDKLLNAVRVWLGEVGLDAVTVQSRWQLTRDQRDTDSDASPIRRVLTWKYEDGPENAPEAGSAADVGPAWLQTYGPYGMTLEKLAGGEWITRAEARSLANEHGYELSEDG